MSNHASTGFQWVHKVMRKAFKLVPGSKLLAGITWVIIVISGALAIYGFISGHPLANIDPVINLVMAGIGFLIIFFVIAPYEVYKEDTRLLQTKIDILTPIHEVQIAQDKSPNLFLSLEPYVILVQDIKGNNEQIEIVLFQARIRSWFFMPLNIKEIVAELELPIRKGQWTHQVVTFHSKAMDEYQLLGFSNGARGCITDVSLLCERNGLIPNTIHMEKHFQAKGRAKVITDEFPEISVNFETTIYLYKIESD